MNGVGLCRRNLIAGRDSLGLGKAVLGYLVLTLLVTWPAARNFSRAVAGFEGLDSLQYAWSLWWSRQAWAVLGHSPAHATLLYYPWGGEHALLAVTPLLDGLALPLYTVLSPTQVYNLFYLASFVLTGVTTYLFALELTGKRLAAFLAGVVFAFCPHRMGHALSGHLTQLAAWWFPLYLQYLLRALRQPSRRHALIAGLFLALSLQIALVQTAYFVAPVTVLLLTYELIARRKRLTLRHLRAGVLLFGLALLLVLPTYGPFFWQVVQQRVELSAPGAVEHSADLVALALPSPYHPLWGHIASQVEGLRRVFPEPNELEHGAFLGWIPLLLSISAIRRRQRGVGLWCVVGVASLWLSLGPALRVGGQTVPVPQPYALLMRLPFYRWGRTPERFNELTMLSVSLLAAYGLAGMRLGRWTGRHQAAMAALIGLAVIEMVVLWPFPNGTPEPPALLADSRVKPGAVLDLPVSKRQIGNLAMYYQTSHAQPIVGGYIHRDLPGMRSYVKAVDAALTDQAGGAERPLTPAEIRGWLEGLDIRHVVLHRQFVEPGWVEGVSARLAEAVGPPVDTGSELVFDVPSWLLSRAPVSTFGSMIALYEPQVEPAVLRAGEQATVTLSWRALEQPNDRYTVFVHLLSGSMSRVAQHDGEPLGGNWPTSLWAPHQAVVDEHVLQLPYTLPAGRYDLGVGLYRLDSGERLTVDRNGVTSDVGMWLLSDALEVE